MVVKVVSNCLGDCLISSRMLTKAARPTAYSTLRNGWSRRRGVLAAPFSERVSSCGATIRRRSEPSGESARGTGSQNTGHRSIRKRAEKNYPSRNRKKYPIEKLPIGRAAANEIVMLLIRGLGFSMFGHRRDLAMETLLRGLSFFLAQEESDMVGRKASKLT